MYALGKTSLTNLEQVKPELVQVVHKAIELTEQDFTVFDGARTVEEQRRLVHAGVSQTMHSKHLIHEDGFGYAVDLVPWIGGRAQWAWMPIYKIAFAVREAALQLNVPVTWGCVWDKLMNEFPARSWEDMKVAGLDYNLRHAGSDFPDGPHFQYGRN